MTDLPRAFTVFLALATLWLTTDRTPAQQESEAPAARLEVRSGSLSVEAHWAQIADSTYKLHEKAKAFRFQPAARRKDIQAKLEGHRWMAADIVYVPRMELVGGTFPDDLEWDREISMEDARERLAKRFYGFANIDWIPFDRVREEARRTGRPMHIMVLFGTLDDESC